MYDFINLQVGHTKSIVPRVIFFFGNAPDLAAFKTNDIIVDLLIMAVVFASASDLVMLLGVTVYNLCGYIVVVYRDVFYSNLKTNIVEYKVSEQKNNKGERKPKNKKRIHK